MSEKEQLAFQIHFDCDGHDVDAVALAKINVAVGALIDAAAVEVGLEKRDYKLRSAVPREGSFEAAYILQFLGDPANYQCVVGTVGLALQCLALWKSRKNSSASSGASAAAFVENSASVTNQFNIGTVEHMAVNAPVAEEAWRDAAGDIAADASIKGFEFIQNGDVLGSFSNEDLMRLSLPERTRLTKSVTMELEVVAPVLSSVKSGVNQWRFECDGKPVNAVVRDAEFLASLDRVSFGAGSTMRAQVIYLSEWDDKKQAYSPEHAYVAKVFEAPGYRWE